MWISLSKPIYKLAQIGSVVSHIVSVVVLQLSNVTDPVLAAQYGREVCDHLRQTCAYILNDKDTPDLISPYHQVRCHYQYLLVAAHWSFTGPML